LCKALAEDRNCERNSPRRDRLLTEGDAPRLTIAAARAKSLNSNKVHSFNS
jgi:hypothetical protein